MSWKCFWCLIYIYVTVRHKNVQSNVPVGHIMFRLYCWNSNVNESFEIKIGSEQNVNSLMTIYFKGKPSVCPHYGEATFMKTMLLLFSHINFTHENISNAFDLTWIFLQLFSNYWKKITTQNLNWFFFCIPFLSYSNSNRNKLFISYSYNGGL